MISIVIPVFNEEKNVVPLYTAINKIMQEISMPYEVIFVDDGSKDNTLRNLKRLQNNGITVGTLRIIELQKNYGQTFALLAGLHNTRGDKIITMDGDQQNDPKDIPRLLQELGKGYDVICGWRKERNDSIMKKVPSRINNFLNRKFNKIAIHDSGCTMRAYRKKALIDIELFAEDHRYLPAILAKKGNTIRELEVTHNHRKNGKSKYGINRLLRGFTDLLTLRWLNKWGARPRQYFFLLSLLLYLVSFFLGIWILLERFTFHHFWGYYQQPILMRNNLLIIILFLCIFTAIMVNSLGFIAEMFYRKTTNPKKFYRIKKIWDKEKEEIAN